jgi:predicted DNA-binding transcriptional regulator AlpA
MSAAATRLRRVRRELDECAEQVDRLANALDKAPTITAKTALVSINEIAAMTGIKPSTLRTMHTRKQLPTPIAQLAIGAVWLRKDIRSWAIARGTLKRSGATS